MSDIQRDFMGIEESDRQQSKIIKKLEFHL